MSDLTNVAALEEFYEAVKKYHQELQSQIDGVQLCVDNLVTIMGNDDVSLSLKNNFENNKTALSNVMETVIMLERYCENNLNGITEIGEYLSHL